MRQSIEARFWKKVTIGSPEDCWAWQAGRSNGRGVFKVDGKARVAARVAYELTHGPITEDRMFVCHRCDNGECVNPAHLFLGTPADNSHDRDQKFRAATGDRNGRRTHPEATARGERTGRSKLKARQVRAIRARYLAGGISMRALGAIYGISHTQVRYLVDGKSWSHLK